MIDILFLSWNRREFTYASLQALAMNTDWSQVRRCWLYDDGSVDGALDVVREFAGKDERCVLLQTHLGSPVATMNDYLLRRQPPEWFAKIDSDTIVPPGWLTECRRLVDEYPGVDLLGIEAKAPVGDGPRTVVATDHIGGIGLMRTAAFTKRSLPVAQGRLGFSDWQVKNPEVGKFWIAPALPTILLDRLPFDPWRKLSTHYEAKGWQRPWKLDTDPKLWEWWKR